MKIKDLYQLIQAMGPSERRYFQLNAGTYSKQRGSQVFRLYQLMSGSVEMEEKVLEKKLLGEKSNGQFHVLKNQLYHQVLEILIRFRGASNVVDRIDILLEKSRILQEKKLYREANRFLKRAAKLAAQHDQFEKLLLIYKDWKRLYAWILEVDKRADHIARFWEKEKEALEKLHNLRTLEWLSMRVFDLYYRIHYAKNEAEKQQYESLMQHPLLEREEAALSFSAKVIYLNTKGLYQDAVGQKAECIESRRRLIALYEAHPERLRQHFSQYLAAFNNYLLAILYEGQYETVSLALDGLQEMPARYKVKMETAEKVMWFRAYFSLRLEVQIRRGNFSAALALVPLVQEQYTKLDKDLNPAFRFPFHYFFAYTNFALGRYEEALEQLEPLIYQVELQFKQELFRFARLLQMFIHLEMGNFDYLASLIRSTRRYLNRLGGTYPLEELMLRFLAKAPYADPKDAFLRLNDELLDEKKALLSPHIIHHFDFRAWIQAQIKNRPFAEMYQEIRV